MGIQKSLAIGGIGENFVISHFTKQGIKTEKHTGKDLITHDLECEFDTTKFHCEVKFDVMAEKTGNLAIEFYNCKKGTPSGLDATKAHIWVHVIKDGNNLTIWLASVKALRAYVKDNPPLRIIGAAGDGNASLYLYKEETLLDAVFNRAETLEEDELKKVIRKLLRWR